MSDNLNVKETWIKFLIVGCEERTIKYNVKFNYINDSRIIVNTPNDCTSQLSKEKEKRENVEKERRQNERK